MTEPIFPDQTCPGCGVEHPGLDCPLQDALDFDGDEDAETVCPICERPMRNGQCFPERQAETHGWNYTNGVDYEVHQKSAPGGAGNTTRGLVASTSSNPKEQPMVDSTPIPDRAPKSVAEILAEARKNPGPLGDVARRVEAVGR